MSNAQTVVLLGASNDTSRYASKAQRLLIEKGHRVVPVTARAAEVDGLEAVHELGGIGARVDTVSVYLRPSISTRYREQLLALKPGRVIFNPGAENPALADALRAEGITCLEECTLVMLRLGRF